MDVRADDRVLVTSLADLEAIGSLAAALSHGSLVGLGDEDQVRAARRAYAHLDHVMFTPGSRTEIPWRDGSFTLIIDIDPAHPSPEMQRVLRPDGRLSAPTPKL